MRSLKQLLSPGNLVSGASHLQGHLCDLTALSTSPSSQKDETLGGGHLNRMKVKSSVFKGDHLITSLFLWPRRKQCEVVAALDLQGSTVWPQPTRPPGLLSVPPSLRNIVWLCPGSRCARLCFPMGPLMVGPPPACLAPPPLRSLVGPLPRPVCVFLKGRPGLAFYLHTRACRGFLHT